MHNLSFIRYDIKTDIQVLQSARCFSLHEPNQFNKMFDNNFTLKVYDLLPFDHSICDNTVSVGSVICEGILLTCRKHLHGRIIVPRGNVRVNKTS